MQHLQWLLLTVLPRYNQFSILWFRISTCFQFWSKTFTKRCTKNSLLSRFILAWTDWSCAFDVRICFGFEKTIPFDFDKKTYIKRCRSNYVASRVKRLSSHVLCWLSGAFNFRVWFGEQMNAVQAKILRLKHDGENLDFRFDLLLFTLLA